MHPVCRSGTPRRITDMPASSFSGSRSSVPGNTHAAPERTIRRSCGRRLRPQTSPARPFLYPCPPCKGEVTCRKPFFHASPLQGEVTCLRQVGRDLLAPPVCGPPASRRSVPSLTQGGQVAGTASIRRPPRASVGGKVAAPSRTGLPQRPKVLLQDGRKEIFYNFSYRLSPPRRSR